MEHSIGKFISLIKKQDLTGVCALYEHANETENLGQLKFMYQSATQNPEVYSFYQDLCVRLMQVKPMPTGLITGLNDCERFDFFAPALKSNHGFSLTNHQGNTAIHILFANPDNTIPPFNYIRSLLLFESNEGLVEALKKRNQQQLTAIECYFAYNPHLIALPAHELSAILALIEVQDQLVEQQTQLLSAICKRLSKAANIKDIKPDNHRVLLLAAAYSTSAAKILTLLKG